jgi:hypothetical protein
MAWPVRGSGGPVEEMRPTLVLALLLALPTFAEDAKPSLTMTPEQVRAPLHRHALLAGGVLLAGGLGLGAMSRGDVDLARRAPSSREAQQLNSRAEVTATAGNVLLGAGGLLLLLGIGGELFAPGPAPLSLTVHF